MTQRHMPREFYLKRAVECFENMGDLRAAAAVLARFGSVTASADAARRYVALGDLPAAGEAYLAAEQIHAALDCFTRARLPERVLACLQMLDDPAAAGALLLELGRPAEALPLLERARAAAARPADQAMVHLQLGQALGLKGGEAHYRAGLAQLDTLPETAASAEAWVALGTWGAAVGRQDRMQEGYAQALRLLDSPPHLARWREVATRYKAAAQAIDNRRLVHILAADLAERAETLPPATPPPDPAQVLLDTGQWESALTALEPRARSGDETAKLFLAVMIEDRALVRHRASIANTLSAIGYRLSAIACPLPLRLKTAALLGEVGDPRLLNPQTGDAPLGGYWCPIDAGPFWFGDDRQAAALRQVSLPYTYRVGRYVVTNAEYRRFIEAGGYQQQQWWTENGWEWKGSRTQPYYWESASYNQPTQPIVGISWYEAAAYCLWLTATGRAARWLPASDMIRLPTSLEWERAARGTDQQRYPWGDDVPDTERANYTDTGIGRPTPVGCFPAGAADCGALDMAGNVMEWMSTPNAAPGQVKPEEDFTQSTGILLSYSGFADASEYLCCGSRFGDIPYGGYFYWSFRVFWSRALTE